jgi:hypothetical protein
MKELMKTHKTSFNINELSWNAPLHKLAADLKAQFAENPMSIEGITNVKISGFSKIRDYAKENKESNMQDILNGLAMIEMFGQTDPSDPDTRTYKIEIDKAGTLKMNGAPFPMDQMMMGGGAGGAMPPQPQ